MADVGCFSHERLNATAADEYLMGPPEIAIEVLPAANTVDEINDKMAICLGNGCRLLFVADPKRRTVSVTHGSTATHYGIGETILITYPAIELRVSNVLA